MNTFFQELFQVGVYKRSQGRITRQVTWACLVAIVVLGLMRLSSTLAAAGKGLEWQYALPGVLFALTAWVFYRLVNVPAVADFLIAVEAEMNKVSWPTWPELFRSSMVVLVLIISLALMLAFCDFAFRVLLHWMGIL